MYNPPRQIASTRLRIVAFASLGVLAHFACDSDEQETPPIDRDPEEIINPPVVSASETPTAISFAHGPLHTDFPRTFDRDGWIEVRGDDWTVRSQPVAITQASPSAEALTTRSATATWTQRSLTYEGLFDGVDLRYDIGGVGYDQTWLVSKNIAADSTGRVFLTESLRFERFPGTLSARMQDKSAERGKAIEGSHPIDFVDADSGRVVARISAPALWDSNPSRLSRQLAVHRLEVVDEGAMRYSIIVPAEYLADAGRVYPVQIDPDFQTPCEDYWCNDGDPCTEDVCTGTYCTYTVPEDVVGDICWVAWNCSDRMINADPSMPIGSETQIPIGCDTDASPPQCLEDRGDANGNPIPLPHPTCIDGNPCTTDECVAGSCVNDPDTDLDDTPCYGTYGLCSSGFCYPNPGVGCFTDPECAGVSGNECVEDVCVDYTCTTGDNVAEGTSCLSGTGLCTSGFCQPIVCESDFDCDDNNDCTDDTCSDPGTLAAACSNDPVAENDACSFGVCDGSGTCVTPVCSADIDCDDNNVCVADTCNNPGEWDANCSYENVPTGDITGDTPDPIATPCGSAGYCDGSGSCTEPICYVSGDGWSSCDQDGNVCTAARCDIPENPLNVDHGCFTDAGRCDPIGGYGCPDPLPNTTVAATHLECDEAANRALVDGECVCDGDNGYCEDVNGLCIIPGDPGTDCSADVPLAADVIVDAICQDYDGFAEPWWRCFDSNCLNNHDGNNDMVIPGATVGCFESHCEAFPDPVDGFGYCSAPVILEGTSCDQGYCDENARCDQPCNPEPDCGRGTCSPNGYDQTNHMSLYACTCEIGWAKSVASADSACDICDSANNFELSGSECVCAAGYYQTGATCTACDLIDGCTDVTCTGPDDEICNDP